MNRILDLLKTRAKRPLVIGIDGMCASGKTTLAAALSRELAAPVIHTDDFFIPRHRRTGTERINIDEKRFVNEVLCPLSQGGELCYGVFDCKTQSITEQRSVPKSEFYIIEGSYCLHPCLLNVYDIKVFCEISEKLQKSRLIEREGGEGYAAFESRWIPLENEYFEKYNIREGCDIIL